MSSIMNIQKFSLSGYNLYIYDKGRNEIIKKAKCYNKALKLLSKGKGKNSVVASLSQEIGDKNEREILYNEIYTFYNNNYKLFIDERKKIKPMTIKELLNYEDNSEYYVNNMIMSGSINMIFSEPGLGKSVISLYQALCISQGKDFLNQETKKVNVGYFDWENPINTIQKRIMAMLGDETDINNFYLMIQNNIIIEKDNGDFKISEDFYNNIVEFVKKNNISVLYFDTIRRLGNFDENDSQIINMIYYELFKPLKDDYGVCIVFIHHTNKMGGYRGSIDLEAICDTVYQLKKDKRNDTYSLTTYKKRNNETDFNFQIEFINDDENQLEEIIFKRESEEKAKENEENESYTYKKSREFILSEIERGKYYKQKELKDLLIQELNFADRTARRHIKWFKDKSIIFYDEAKKSYYLPSEDLVNKKREINIYITNQLKQYDIISISNLNNVYDEQVVYEVLQEDFFKKGLVSEPRKGEIHSTDLFKQENPEVEITEVYHNE